MSRVYWCHSERIDGMNKVHVLNWRFRFSIILAVLISWVATVGPVHAAGPELQVITEIAPPASFIDEQGKLTGLAIEIVQAIQQEIGVQTDIQVMPWARGYQELTETPNVALFPTTRTPEREKLFQWVGPLFTTRWIIYARKGSGLRLTSLEDAKSIKRIGVYRDDARAQFLRDQGFDNLDIANRQELNPAKLLAGRVDAILYSDLTLKEFFAKSDMNPELVEPIFEVGARDIYIAFSMDSDLETIRVWREAFDRLEKRGDLQRIRDKWLP